MTDLMELYTIAAQNHITVDCFKLRKREALSIMDSGELYIAIDPFQLRSEQDEKMKLSHELGHCMTGSFYNEWSTVDIRERHEYRADKWAVHRLIPFEDFRRAIKDGNIETWQLAEYFDVTEDFIRRTEYVYQCEGKFFEG